MLSDGRYTAGLGRVFWAMAHEYVEERDGGYYVAGSRISLDSIVNGFLGGLSAEAIGQAFPLLSLEQVYGALAFYLAHRDAVDATIAARSQTRCSTRSWRPSAARLSPREKWSASRRTPISTRPF
jgi:uncharacterized protein (DUF433 family)